MNPGIEIDLLRAQIGVAVTMAKFGFGLVGALLGLIISLVVYTFVRLDKSVEGMKGRLHEIFAAVQENALKVTSMRVWQKEHEKRHDREDAA